MPLTENEKSTIRRMLGGSPNLVAFPNPSSKRLIDRNHLLEQRMSNLSEFEIEVVREYIEHIAECNELPISRSLATEHMADFLMGHLGR